jgi:RecB family exonuclease
MDLLLAAPLRPLRLADGSEREPPVARWDALSRAANVVEGRAAWTDGLAGLRRRARLRAESPEAEAEERRAAEAEAECVAAFAAFLDTLFTRLEAIGNSRSWTDRAEGVARLHEELFADGGEAGGAAVRAACRELGGLDRVAAAPGREEFGDLLEEALARRSPQRGAFGREEPAVLPLLDARGVGFDIVLLPGLVEKGFPAAARQDPLLSDGERRRLAGVLSEGERTVRLEPKSRRREEERLLFALACQSARQRLVLTFSRLDPASGRTRVPSYFLLEVLGVLRGAAADYGDLERFLREDERGAVVPLREGLGPPREATHRFGHDLAWAEAAVATSGPAGLAPLGAVSPFFARGRAAEAARYGTHAFTIHDGVLRDGALRAALRARLLDPDRPLSPSRLETYARCPFAYFFRYVLGIVPQEEPESTRRLDPLERGSLYHEILRRFYRELVDAGRRRARAEDLPRLGDVAAAVLDAFEREGRTGLPGLWEVDRAELAEDVLEAVRRETGADDGWEPRHLEVAFGSPPGEGEEPALPGAERPVPFGTALGTVAFLGRIDRIDRTADGAAARVLDYKTGAKKPSGFAGGTQLQLPVYLLAARQLLPDAEAREAAYAFWTRRGGFATGVFPREKGRETWEEDFRTVLEMILEGIAEGVFFPRDYRPDVCDGCDIRRICGHARTTWKWRHPEQPGIRFQELGAMA